MDIKLISLDMDGTLMDSSGNIPDTNVKALRECARRGIYVMLNSGRSYEVLTGYEKILGVPCVISSANGARIDMGGRTVFENFMDRVPSQGLFDFLLASGVYFCAYTRSTTFMYNLDDRDRNNIRRHEPGFQEYPGGVYETRIGGNAAPDGVYKYVCFSIEYDPRFAALRRYGNEHGFFVSSSWCSNVEFMPQGSDKGSAIRRVCRLTGIEKENVMAFGDSENDIEMFAASGYPVAMAGSPQAGKTAYTAPGHEIGGVGLFLNDFVLKD